MTGALHPDDAVTPVGTGRGCCAFARVIRWFEEVTRA
jgi:hypothetical protein